MVHAIDEFKAEGESAKAITFDEELVERVGSSNQRLMDRQSILMASTALRLSQKNSLKGGRGLGLYCVLEILDHDLEVANILRDSNLSLTQKFQNEIRPTRYLQTMPCVQAFWSALAVQAQGPVRIFFQSSFAEKAAMEQAELDLQDGLCETAIILNVALGPERVSGRVLTRTGD